MNDLAGSAPLSLMDFVKAAKSRIRELIPAEADQAMQRQPQLLLVDVREPSEYEQGHIASALLIPRGILEAAADPAYPKHVAALAAARRRPVLLYCATGGRSALAAATLQLMGFEDVLSLDGGFSRWEQEGRPVAREARYV